MSDNSQDTQIMTRDEIANSAIGSLAVKLKKLSGYVPKRWSWFPLPSRV
jgi:hypothetical protein